MALTSIVEHDLPLRCAGASAQVCHGSALCDFSPEVIFITFIIFIIYFDYFHYFHCHSLHHYYQQYQKDVWSVKCIIQNGRQQTPNYPSTMKLNRTLAMGRLWERLPSSFNFGTMLTSQECW